MIPTGKSTVVFVVVLLLFFFLKALASFIKEKLCTKMPLGEAHVHQPSVRVIEGGLSSTPPGARLLPAGAGTPRGAPWLLSRKLCRGVLLRDWVVFLPRGSSSCTISPLAKIRAILPGLGSLLVCTFPQTSKQLLGFGWVQLLGQIGRASCRERV